MPLYRTNSDRGLWKKYRREQPQHFHKPCYLNLDKEKPQVTYSQLNLGDGYRANSRQSNPNIRADIDSSSSINDKYRHYKSAPTTPRCTTPTRIRSRNRAMMNGDGHETLPQTTHQRPLTATSIYSQETTFSGYPDENASSWDSRSLGRDSALGPYMSASASNYGHGNGFLSDTPDRPNPFVHGSSIAAEADNVVAMFLNNMNTSRRPPGRIEDLPSPEGTGPLATSDHPQLFHRQNHEDDEADAAEKIVGTNTVISQLRRDFFNRDFPQQYEKTEPPKKTNKYLRPENRWSKPAAVHNDPEQVAVVQGFVAPQMHHAEVVHVRQDSTSTEASGETPVPSSSVHERSFEDPAAANFREEQGWQHEEESSSSASPVKKRGFLASLFKKSSSKQQQQQNQHQDYYNDEVNNDYQEQPSQEDAPTLSNDTVTDDDAEDLPMPKLLPRKRSMSKPTDLDEILRMQEAMEKEQSVVEVFANDPFFQSTLAEYNIDLPPSIPSRAPVPRSVPIKTASQDPIYENHKSMDTTQEIDIDALLGYNDEEAIENIEWPSQDPLSTVPAQSHEHVNNEVQIDYSQPATQPKSNKRGFFSFGRKTKKKPDKNDEVSYYIEEPQPEPPMEAPPPLPVEPPPSDDTFEPEPALDNEEVMNTSRDTNKPSFFNFKGRKGQKQEAKLRRENSVGETDKHHDQGRITPNSTAASKPSFFKIRGSSGSKKAAPSHKRQQQEHEEETTWDREEASVPPEDVTNGHEMEENVPNAKDSHYQEAELPPGQEDIESQEHQEKQVGTNDGNDETVLGPIREEKPSFVTELSKTDTSDSEPRGGSGAPPKSKKFGGFSSFFKGSKKAPPVRRDSVGRQIGTMAPVDISHLIDDEEGDDAQDMYREDGNIPSPTSSEPLSKPMEQADRRGRPRQRQKSGGFANFFGPPKPKSRPSSQTRNNQFERDNRRTRSMPRQRPASRSGGGLADFFDVRPPQAQSLEPQEPEKVPEKAPPEMEPEKEQQPEVVKEPVDTTEPRRSSSTMQPAQRRPPPKSKSMGGFFSMQPKQRQPPMKREQSVPHVAESPNLQEEERGQTRAAPPTKSKSMTGFFSLQPKHPRRPVVPPPQPPTTTDRGNEEEEVKSEQQQPTRASSSSSLASRQRRESKGLANFLSASPLRKSTRLPNSKTLPTLAASENTEPSSTQRDRQENKNETDVDKIELAPDQASNVHDKSVPEAGMERQQPSDRVMGRRSGRFRKQPHQTTPSQLQGPHRMPAPNNTSMTTTSSKDVSTEHSFTRDLFAETVNRPSRRGSMTSLNQPSKETTDVLPPDTEYDQAVNKGMGDELIRRGATRNDSYKRAKGGGNEDKRSAMRNYNSLPRMGNRQGRGQQHSRSVTTEDDPETKSLGDHRQQRRGQQRGNDNCQMM